MHRIHMCSLHFGLHACLCDLALQMPDLSCPECRRRARLAAPPVVLRRTVHPRSARQESILIEKVLPGEQWS